MSGCRKSAGRCARALVLALFATALVDHSPAQPALGPATEEELRALRRLQDIRRERILKPQRQYAAERVRELRASLAEAEEDLARLLRSDSETSATIPAVPGIVEVAASDSPIEDVVAIINRQIPNSLFIHGKLAGQRVSVLADGQPVEEVLSSIANPKGWVWWKEKNGDYGLGDVEFYERNAFRCSVVQKVFYFCDRKPSELDRLIKGMLTPNIGTSVASDRSHKLIVNDLPSALVRIEKVIHELEPEPMPGS